VHRLVEAAHWREVNFGSGYTGSSKQPTREVHFRLPNYMPRGTGWRWLKLQVALLGTSEAGMYMQPESHEIDRRPPGDTRTPKRLLSHNARNAPASTSAIP
jgi:hypothetical protein